MQFGYSIALDGVEGSGKSEQSRRCGMYLHEKGVMYQIVRPLHDTELGRRMKKLILDPQGLLQLDPHTEMALFGALQRQAAKEKIEPAIAKGTTVIVPGYTFARIAYQGFGNELDESELGTQDELIREEGLPDITFILNQKGRAARDHANKKNAAYFFQKGRDLQYYARVTKGFRKIAQRYRRDGAILVERDTIENTQSYIQRCLDTAIFDEAAQEEMKETIEGMIRGYKKGLETKIGNQYWENIDRVGKAKAEQIANEARATIETKVLKVTPEITLTTRKQVIHKRVFEFQQHREY